MRTKESLVVAVAASILSAGIILSHAAFADDAPQRGTWQPHEYEFNYTGFTSTYSCEGLSEKLRLLLRSVGAREDLQLASSGCDRGFGTPSKFARVKLTFFTLQPMQPQPTAGASSRDEDADGVWRARTLAPHRPSELSDGDCELVEQFRDKVLPMFATRALQDRTRCVPHQSSAAGFSLNFEVFAPIRSLPSTVR